MKAAESTPLAAFGIMNNIARPKSQWRVTLVARKIIGDELVGFLAMRAQHAHQTLANDDAQA